MSYQYFSYSTCLEEFLGGHSASKVDFSGEGGQPILIKSQVRRKEGGHSYFGPIPQFPRFLAWKDSVSDVTLLPAGLWGQSPVNDFDPLLGS